MSARSWAVKVSACIDLVEPKVSQCAGEAVIPSWTVPRLDPRVIGEMSKFDVHVDQARRLTPASGQVEAQLGGCHERDNQGLGVEAIGGKWTQLVLPAADHAARAQLDSDQGERGD